MKQSKLSPITIDRAVELYALTPNAVHKEISEELGISSKQLLKLRREPKFWADVYDRYMITFEGDIPDVLRAAVREAKAGNVQAQRLVLEHSGKLQKHLSITIKSPWELWVASKNNQLEPTQEINQRSKSSIDIQDAEIVTDKLPDRTADNSPQKAHDDFIKLDKAMKKKQAWNERRRELYEWQVRARAVEVAPLPAKRPTPGQRKQWENTIIEKEKKYLDGSRNS